jgi:hypothetical protein
MRSSLTSTPQYVASSGTSTGFHRHSTSDNVGMNRDAGVPDGSVGMDSSTARRPATTGSVVQGISTNTPTRHAVSRVQFCHPNIVACINCQPSSLPSAGWGNPSMATMSLQDLNLDNSYGAPTPPRVNRKLGPILLDLRELVASQHHVSPDQRPSTEIPSLFTTRTITLSRGNPSLGTSVSSTCLDVSSFLPSATFSSSYTHRPSPCATGLTTGALCIHTFAEADDGDGANSLTSSIEYFHTPRHHRQATAVSWRRHNSRHVAVGLVSSAMAGATPMAMSSTHHMSVNMNMNMNLPAMNARVRGGPNANPAATAARGGGGSGGSGGGGGGGDREFCCFLWDIEHQASAAGGPNSATGAKRTNTSPLFKLSHNAGVASLAWLLEGGQTLAVGGQQRNIQLYDLRVSGTSSATPPISAFGHNSGVHGIEVDPCRPYQFATFSRAAEEPVKIWDARRMDSVVSEIKIDGILHAAGSQSTTVSSIASSTDAATKSATVSALRWSSTEAGVLSVAVGNVVLDYDTSSRPVLSRVSRSKGRILDVALYPSSFSSDYGSNVEGSPVRRTKLLPQQASTATAAQMNDMALIRELYPHRMLVILADRCVQDMAKHTIAPLDVSRRDGRVVHALGKDLFFGSTQLGPLAMESMQIRPDVDISATMMRRARCVQTARYSMATTSNIQLLAEEMPLDPLSVERDALLRLWTWIDRMESLCSASHEEMANMEDGAFWWMKGFDETGVWKLLDLEDENQRCPDIVVRSDSLACDVFDSAVRR